MIEDVSSSDVGSVLLQHEHEKGEDVLTLPTGVSPQPSLILRHATLTCPVESLAVLSLTSGHWAECASGGLAFRLRYLAHYPCWSTDHQGQDVISLGISQRSRVYEEKISE